MSIFAADEIRELRARRWRVYAKGNFFDARMAILNARAAAVWKPDEFLTELGRAAELHRRARYGLARMRTA